MPSERFRLAAISAALLAFGARGPTGTAHADPRPEGTAKNIRVECQVWDERDQKNTTIAKGRAGPEWFRRLAAVTMPQGKQLPASPCPVACGRCPDQLSTDVSYVMDDDNKHLSLKLREGLAFLTPGTSSKRIFEEPMPAWSFEDSIPAVLALLREAMPDDPVLRAWMPSPARPAPLDSDSAAYRHDYIHVQKLPEAVKKVPPRYPDMAREMGVAGEVHVQALVAADGSVARVQVAKSIRRLDDAALEAVRAWRFKPAVCAGRPVAVWVMVPVRFTLH